MCHFFFFFKQKTAYEMRISDWSSDVCSSDLRIAGEDVIEAMLRFETPMITGTGYVRLQVDDTGNPRAWTLLTAIDTLKGHELETERLKRDGTAYERDWKGPKIRRAHV